MSWIPNPVYGDILLPTWFKTADQIRNTFGPDSYPEYRVGNFSYHIWPTGRYASGSLRQKIEAFRFFLRRGLELVRSNKYDIVMTYGWTLTGIAALILKFASGAKLLIEVGNTPHHYNRFGRMGIAKQTIALRLSRVASDALLYLLGSFAAHLQLRYPRQLEHYPLLQKKPCSVIHGFVPVSSVPFTGHSDNVILLVGAPWYLKGVDVLIRAFQKIHHEFPQFTLRVIGYYPDTEPLEKLAEGNPAIEIRKPLPNPEVMMHIANCTVFVLASRTEAGGRVLLEAMAAGKPIIASDVDGNPVYVRDGVNGLLFESENVDDLARKLRMVLGSPELRKRLGDKGYELAHTAYSETAFGEQFRTMAAVAAGRPDLAAPRLQSLSKE